MDVNLQQRALDVGCRATIPEEATSTEPLGRYARLYLTTLDEWSRDEEQPRKPRKDTESRDFVSRESYEQIILQQLMTTLLRRKAVGDDWLERENNLEQFLSKKPNADYCGFLPLANDAFARLVQILIFDDSGPGRLLPQIPTSGAHLAKPLPD